MVIFKGRKTQDNSRIRLPKPIIDTLKLKKNNPLDMEFNEEKREVIIKFK